MMLSTVSAILAKNGTLAILCGMLQLQGGWPVVDGKIYSDVPFTFLVNTNERLEAQYDLGKQNGIFKVVLVKGETKVPYISYQLTLPPGKNVLSFGLHFQRIEGLLRFYRSGYNSWDGSEYVQPANMTRLNSWNNRPELGYGLTQLIPQNLGQALVLGFDRHDRYQQTFRFNTHSTPPSLEISTWWDEKTLATDRICQSEKLCLLTHQNYEEGLRDWARLVARTSPLAPRTEKTPILGWCSWYDMYATITEDNVNACLNDIAAVVKKENLPMTYFQIDDGFTPEMGDWLLADYDFPSGIKSLVTEIRKSGFKPGLWIAPFMIGNRSTIYAQHPDWVLKDKKTSEPKAWWQAYGEYRWHKRSEEYYVLDATHPAAFAYLRNVFRTWRQDWGADYFKTDFVLMGTQYGPDEVVYHTPGLTRIEIFRKVAEMIREEIGDDATWLGCGFPLWASVGLVDGIRIGGDVGVSWSGRLSAQSLLKDQRMRNFANHILWQVDPDCILLRSKYHHLSDIEVRSLALYAGMSGGVTMTSDNLAEFAPERLKLWKLLLVPEKSTCSYPFMGRTQVIYEMIPGESWDKPAYATRFDPMIVQVRPLTNRKGYVVHLFNSSHSTVQRSYTLTELGIDGQYYVWDWTANQAWNKSVTQISVDLPAHASRLLFLKNSSWKKAPQTLAGNE